MAHGTDTKTSITTNSTNDIATATFAAKYFCSSWFQEGFPASVSSSL